MLSSKPSGAAQQAAAKSASPSPATTDPKRPYGGLVQTPQKGTGAFRDAAAYHQHLTQQQAYTAQQQAATQAAQNVYRNPYLQQQPSQPSSTQGASSTYNNQSESSHNSYKSSHPRLIHHSSHGQLNASGANTQYAGAGAFPVSSQQLSAPSNTYQTGNRARSNTLNHMVDNIPPALARLQHMNQDVIGGRKALTPVLKRDDALREWERRQQGGKQAAAQPYPQLEILQQQAEMAAAQGMGNWTTYSNQPQLPSRYPVPPSNLSHSYSNMVVDDDRREAVMSNVRQAARSDNGSSVMYSSGTNVIPSPPQAYASNSTTTGNRYAATYAAQTPTSPFDALDRRADMGSMYVPMQPDQYGPYNPASSQANSQSSSSRQVAAPAQAVPPSFYGASVVPSGQQQGGQRNPYGPVEGLPPAMSTKDSRRKSGMDLWS
jgi:dual specificity protein kinase YAK1